MAARPPRRDAAERGNLLGMQDVASPDFLTGPASASAAAAAAGVGRSTRAGSAVDRLNTSINRGFDDVRAGTSASAGAGEIPEPDSHGEDLPSLQASDSMLYKALSNAVRPPPLPYGIIEEVHGDIADHPFPDPPKSTAGTVAMTAFKMTGLGYVYYRVANTRLLPGYITYLQDGSHQYVIARPGLYYFPGPTRTLYVACAACVF